MVLGCCIPRDPSKARSMAIEEALERERKEMKSESKLLLLGAGESGKSTIVKQMKIIFAENGGYTEEERLLFKPVIFSNTVQSMLAILQGMSRLQIPFANPERQTDADFLVESSSTLTDVMELPLDVIESMLALWNDLGVQACFIRASEYQLNDSAGYFLNNLDRLFLPDYIPNVQDVLRTRLRTTGIVESSFTMKKHRFRIVDVGGQRTERKKWVHCFEGVTAVIFVAALNDYDLTLDEDNTVNRMIENLQLFKGVCNNRFFSQSGMILFLNKKDLFAEKLRLSPITTCFPDYTGPNSYESSLQYIQDQFEALDLRDKVSGHKRQVYVHVTCATDTSSMQFVFAALADMIIEMNLIHAGIF